MGVAMSNTGGLRSWTYQPYYWSLTGFAGSLAFWRVERAARRARKSYGSSHYADPSMMTCLYCSSLLRQGLWLDPRSLAHFLVYLSSWGSDPILGSTRSRLALPMIQSHSPRLLSTVSKADSIDLDYQFLYHFASFSMGLGSNIRQAPLNLHSW